MLPLLLLLQAVYGPRDPDREPAAPDPPAAGTCPGAANGDIIVCARRRGGQSDRISEAKDEVEPILPKAEFRLFGGGRLAVHGQQASVGGFTSNRAMVTLSLPF